MLVSPLRYPGGKVKLARFFSKVMLENDALDCLYVEPFAGGAGAALRLLSMEYARRIWINDLDPAVYCFWRSVLDCTDELCALVANAKLSVAEWRGQREIYRRADTADPLALGFATLYMNRTNRSGVLTGSVIGGLDQTGTWKIDVRFPKDTLISRIEKIADYGNRIKVTSEDAIKLVNSLPDNPKQFIYLDPPYFNNGRRLYLNHYGPDDHTNLAAAVQTLPGKWLVTYNDADEIRQLYEGLPIANFSLNYSAAVAKKGCEILISAPDLILQYDELPGWENREVA